MRLAAFAFFDPLLEFGFIPPLSFYSEQVVFSIFVSVSMGGLPFVLFCFNLFKQGQNDAAKIRTGDSGLY